MLDFQLINVEVSDTVVGGLVRTNPPFEVINSSKETYLNL
jgi:hypothetical protein